MTVEYFLLGLYHTSNDTKTMYILKPKAVYKGRFYVFNSLFFPRLDHHKYAFDDNIPSVLPMQPHSLAGN